MTSKPIATAQILTGIAAAMALLYYLSGILVPLVIAFVLVVLVDALTVFINGQWPQAPGWVVSAVTGLVVILLAAGGMFVLAQGAAQVVQEGPALLARIDALVQQGGQSVGLDRPLHLQALVGSVSIPEIAGSVLQAIQGIAGAILLIVIYFGFMLTGRRRMDRKVDVIAGTSDRRTQIKAIVEHITADIRTYLWVQAVTGVMLAAAAAAVMLIVGLDHIPFWTIIFFLLTFIPNIGVTIGSVAPALFALLQFDSIWQAVAIFVVIQVAAVVVGNLIYPKMQADTQNIDPVTTIVALSLWTFLWGVPGAFLAVPMTLMLMMAFAQFESTRWIAAALSNDGKPSFRKSGAGQ